MGARLNLIPALLLWGAPLATAAAAPPAVQDLRAAIALQGFPCDKVIESKRNDDSDYTAACRDGHRYHVFVDAAGRVVVKKL